MAKYNASQTLECWKQHRCFGCGALYRYRFKRRGTAQARNAADAQAAARNNLNKLLANTVDQQPCPGCGCYQPEMIAQSRRGRYAGFGWIFWITLIVAAILVAADALPIATVTLAVTAFVAFAALAEAWTAFHDRNASLDSNRRTAEAAIAKDMVRLDVPGAGNQPHLASTVAPRPSPAFYALLALGVLALPVAEGFRIANHWPLNDTVYPQVVGAGDSTTFYMPESITSIKGYWRGTPGVKVLNATDLGLPSAALDAHAKDNSWSGTISVKSSEKSESNKPWIEFNIPEQSDLTGKVAHLTLKLHTEFPQMVGSSTYHTVQRDFDAATDLTFAPPGSGKLYVGLWFFGLLGSFVILLVAVIGLGRHARKTVTVTQTGIIPLENPNPPSGGPTPPPMPGSAPPPMPR